MEMEQKMGNFYNLLLVLCYSYIGNCAWMNCIKGRRSHIMTEQVRISQLILAPAVDSL